MTPSQREVIRKLVEVYGITHLYTEDKFYETHKISRADFLGKVELAPTQAAKDSLILALYDDPAI